MAFIYNDLALYTDKYSFFIKTIDNFPNSTKLI